MRALRALSAGARRHPLAFLALLVVLQTAFTLASRDYWAFDEPRHADALRELLDEGHWLSLHVNGQPYPDKPPVYFWLAAGAARLLGTDGPPAFFLVSALGGLAFLFATRSLARSTAPRVQTEAALLAPVLVLLAPLTQLLLRTTRMDLLFGALIVFSWTALGRGLRSDARGGFVPGGLALAGLATVVKGPVGLALPLAALLAFTLWTGRWRRLLAWDVAAGLVLALLPIALWMVGVAAVEGWPYLRDSLQGQVVARAVGSHKHSQGFWFYLLVLPAAWLPWSALLATLPYRKVTSLPALRAALARRRHATDGNAWLGACFLGGLVVLSVATSKLFIYAMPLLAPVAVLSVRWWARLGDEVRDRTARIVGVMLGGLGVAVAVLPALVPFEDVGFSPLHLLPAVLFVAGGAVAFLRRRRGLAASAGALFAGYVALALVTIPSFDPVMSPRAQAESLARYADAGYAPLVYKVYPGTYAYYARRTVPETRDVKRLVAHLEENPRAVVATGRKYLERFPQLLGPLRLVQEQRIEGQPHVLLVQESEGAPPR